MDNLEFFEESANAFIDDDLSKVSTAAPEVFSEETSVGILVIIIVSAILSITLLFVIAIFIDCRQQKLASNKQKPVRSLFNFNIPIPRFMRSESMMDDNETFADKMQTEDTNSPSTVIVH